MIVAAAVLAAAGCDKGSASAESESSRERVNAVEAKPVKTASVAEMCDVFPDAGSRPAFATPPLARGKIAAPAGRWRWVNVWATWCKPCVEEMPLLASFHKRLTQGGAKLDIVFLSADDTDDKVAEFRKAHPTTPDGPRLASADALEPWLSGLGVAGASLPVHVFVDPEGQVRCVRAAAIDDHDYDAVAALVGSAR